MKILISGAGITGLTLAYWLKKFGHEPELIEIWPELRNQGYMMDFFGSGYDVGEAMGLLEALKKVDKTHGFKDLIFANAKMRPHGSLTRKKMQKHLGGRYLSIMRGELEDLLYKQIKKDVPIQFSTSIKSIQELKKSAKVTFEDGRKESYDLVVGADGIHSKVRELVFGPEKRFKKFLGYHVAAFLFKDPFKLKNNLYTHTEVDRMVGVHPLGKNKKGMAASFMVWASKSSRFVSPEKRKDLIRKKFKGMEGYAPGLLEKLDETDQLFFDEVTQIEMPTWHKGRVVLAGDAGACLTLLAGQGATMGMTEAYVLANELRKEGGNYQAAFENYERVLMPVVEQKQKEARNFTSSFIPKNKRALFFYNLATRIMHWPMMLPFVFRGIDLESIFDSSYELEK